MAFPAAAATVVPEDLRAIIAQCARATSVPYRLVVRAQIVLAAVEGQSTYAIAKRLGCAESTVRKWRGRIEERPCLAVLEDLPRSGRPALVPTEVRCDVVRIACTRPRDNFVPFRDIWSYASLADAVAIETGWELSTSEIHRILTGNRLRPHQVRGWLHSPDPMFREKVKVITDLYLNLPPGATVLSFDEKPGMQAREHKHPMSLATAGESGRIEFEYKRHGTVTLLAAFNVGTGEVMGRCARRTGDNIVSFFDSLAEKYPSGPVYVVMDNLNVHKGVRWEPFHERHGRRFHFVYTPLHASWVNQIEIWFGILQRRIIKHGSFRSQAELADRVMAFIAHWNQVEAHPFRWRFRAFKDPSPLALAA
jgi:transposase